MTTMYRVEVGEDVYIGTAAEVVAFMARAEGLPEGSAEDIDAYMQGVAARIGERLGIDGIARDDPEAFLESISEHGVLKVSAMRAPSDERTDPVTFIGEDIVTYAEDVDPRDVDLGDEGE